MSLKLKRILSISLVVVTVVLLGLVPLFVHKDSVMNILILVLLYITLASSWNILGGYTGQSNLGHAAFFGLGSVTTRLLWLSGFPFFLSFLAGGLVAVAFALLIGIPAFRLKGVYFAIGTLALSQILNVTVGNVLPEMSYNPELTNYQIAPRYLLFLGLAIVTVGAGYFLVRSRFGFGLKAVKESEDAAESLGINSQKHKLIALVFSAFFAGLAGSAFAYYFVSYYHNMVFHPSWTFDSMMMAYLGGTGTIIGPIIGAIFFVVLKEFLVLNVGEYHLIIFGTLFILVVLFLPGGLVEAWNKVRKVIRNYRSRRQKVEKKIPSKKDI